MFYFISISVLKCYKYQGKGHDQTEKKKKKSSQKGTETAHFKKAKVVNLMCFYDNKRQIVNKKKGTET